MNKKILTPLIVACLVATPFVASAADIVQSANVDVTVDGQCSLFPIADVYMGDGSAVYSMSSSVNTMVLCNDQLPYTLEIDSRAGGFYEVQDAITGRTYDVKFTKDAGSQGWGSTANGDDFSSVGTGQIQQHMFGVSFNDNGAYGQAQAGVYVGQPTVTLSFL